MRKALALAAFLAMAPYAQAQEEGATAAAGTFTPNAEYRVRYQYDNNIAGNDTVSSQDSVRQRFKLGGTFKATDELSASFTLLHNAYWGSYGFGYGGTGDGSAESVGAGSGRARLNGIGDNQNMVLVQEAYGTWMVNDSLTLRFGRGSFTMGDGTVIHTNDWDATPVSFEGVLATYEMEVGRLNAFAVRFAEYANPATGTSPASATVQDPEANSYGLSYSHKLLPEFLNRADVHVNQVSKAYTGTGATPASAAFGQSITRYGVSLGGDVAMIDWRAVYNAHMGDYVIATAPAVTEVDANGNMMEAEIGANFEEFMNSRFYVYYHQDTGDDGDITNGIDSYDPYFYYRHGNAGLMDVLGWGNLTDMAVGYTMQPGDATTVGLHYHMFKKTDADGTTNGGLWGTRLVNGMVAGEDDLGQEIDLEAVHSYDNGLMITGRLGAFMPGDAFGTNDDTYGTAFVEAKMNF